MQGYKTLDMNAENGVPVESGFVHFLTRAGNCEGNRKIEFGGSVFSDSGNEVSYHRMPSGQAIKIFLIICDTQPKVKRKYPVSFWIWFGGLAGSPIRQVGVVHSNL